jgi:hypothetical protein
MSNVNANEPIVAGSLDPAGGKATEISTQPEINEKTSTAVHSSEKNKIDDSVNPVGSKTDKLGGRDSDEHGSEHGSHEVVIVTGADAATHLLPMRDDHDPAVTFRSLLLATILSAFQACVYQIYIVREKDVSHFTVMP